MPSRSPAASCRRWRKRLPIEPFVYLNGGDMRMVEVGRYTDAWSTGDSPDQANIQGPTDYTLPLTRENNPYGLLDIESSDDFTVWTFYFREGMKFSDGSPFTVHDVPVLVARSTAQRTVHGGHRGRGPASGHHAGIGCGGDRRLHDARHAGRAVAQLQPDPDRGTAPSATSWRRARRISASSTPITPTRPPWRPAWRRRRSRIGRSCWTGHGTGRSTPIRTRLSLRRSSRTSHRRRIPPCTSPIRIGGRSTRLISSFRTSAETACFLVADAGGAQAARAAGAELGSDRAAGQPGAGQAGG